MSLFTAAQITQLLEFHRRVLADVDEFRWEPRSYTDRLLLAQLSWSNFELIDAFQSTHTIVESRGYSMGVPENIYDPLFRTVHKKTQAGPEATQIVSVTLSKEPHFKAMERVRTYNEASDDWFVYDANGGASDAGGTITQFRLGTPSPRLASGATG